MKQSILDNIISSLSADAIKYFFPGYSAGRNDSEDFFRTTKTEDKANDYIRFSIIGNDLEEAVPFGDFATGEETAPFWDCVTEDTSFFELTRTESSQSRRGTGGKSSRATRRITPEQQPAELELDPRTKAILDEIEALKKKYGISIEELEAVLSYNVRLSRLRITRHKEIILDDFDRQEVKMDTLTKAVFLLFLKHPEGIRYKELCDYRNELESIYCSISGRTDLPGIRKSISDLTDSVTSNSIHEKVSKAKKAFRDVIDDRVAKFYYIDGKQGAAKRIALDRSLVIWE